MVLLWLLLHPAPAYAASFTVDTLIDENDWSCSDGDCSLRDAISLANWNGQSDTITFSVSGTISLSLGPLWIGGDSGLNAMTIDGGSTIIIDAMSISNAIQFASSGHTLKNITIQNAGSGGGAIQVAASNITLDNVTVRNNRGHGIVVEPWAVGTQIQNCTSSYNGTNEYNYGIYIAGDNTVVEHCDVSYSKGHGIAVVSGASGTRILNNVLRHNGQAIVGSYAGSGIAVVGNGTDNTLIRYNQIHSNIGNGITIAGGSTDGPADTQILNNTISNNSQSVIDGVGIHIAGVIKDGDADGYSILIRGNSIYGNYAQGILVESLVESGGVGSPQAVYIGGPSAGDRNYVYSNGQEGILLRDTGTNNNIIENNYVGIDQSTAAYPNGNSGIAIVAGAQQNVVKGNDIRYNTYQDILLSGNGTRYNIISGNHIESGSCQTPPVYDNTGIVVTNQASDNTIGAAGNGNVVLCHKFEGVLILGPGTDRNNVIYNELLRNGRGVSVINYSVPMEDFPRVDTDPSHYSGGSPIMGPDQTVISQNQIYANNADGIYVKLSTRINITQNTVRDNLTNGILITGSSGSVSGNLLNNNGRDGIRVEPHFGTSDDPATHHDDTLSSFSIAGNTVGGNGQAGIHGVDNEADPTREPGALNNDNTLNSNGRARVLQEWLGSAEVLDAIGNVINSGVTGQITTATGGCASWGYPFSLIAFDSAMPAYSSGIWGPGGAQYEHAGTWFLVPEDGVANDGTYYDCTPQQINASTLLLSGTAQFSWDGNDATHPVSPDVFIPFSLSPGDRYQVAEVRLGSTPTPTPTPTPTSSPQAQLPKTGFAPNRTTVLSSLPKGFAYRDLGPLWLEIPNLGVKASIVGVPQQDGSWEVTWLWDQIGWLENTAFPGWSGNTVLVGHSILSSGLPGPFVGLPLLRPKDQIVLHVFGDSLVYQVVWTHKVRPNALWILDHADQDVLTLITCTGWNEKLSQYDYRWVVRAVPMH